MDVLYQSNFRMWVECSLKSFIVMLFCMYNHWYLKAETGYLCIMGYSAVEHQNFIFWSPLF